MSTGGSSGGSTFSVSLADEVSRPAASAAQALTQLRGKIDADTKALRLMQAAMGRLKGGTTTDVAAFRSLRAQVAAQRSSIANAQAAYVSLGGTFEATAAQGDAMSGVFDAVRAAPGPVGHLAGRFAALANPITAAVAVATAGIGVFVALTAAVLNYAVALGRMALASADARRSEALHLEGLTTLRNYYGIAAGSATDLVNAIDRVSDASALSRGEISGMAESLYRAGLRGANLDQALEGLSIAQSVQGDRGAARFRALAVSIVRTGGSVRRLTDDYRTRLGGIASRQALGLDRQMEHLRESVSRIFATVRIEGFLRGLHSVISLFSQSTITGRALQQLAGTIFSPLFDSVGEGAPTVINALQDMVIGTQRVVIEVLRAEVAMHRFSRAFQNAEGIKALHNLGNALTELDAVLHISDASFAGIETTLRALFPTLSTIADTVRGLATAFNAGGQPLGTALANGLADGIRAGTGQVRAATRALGGDAEDGAAQALEVHSPSRVFARMGRQVPRGFAAGVTAATSTAAEAVVGMGDAVAASGPEAAQTGASAAQTRPSVTIGDVHLHLARGGEEEGRTAAQAFMEMLAQALEGGAVEMGAA